ncbi:hypothetical protein HBI64_026100 [Parastagonospora nodorum]|nr:hypothetical protein HBI64_026100 [Parastagonospora nodorum]
MSHPTLPVRAALIGLSSSAITSWASSAHLPALLSPIGCSKITLKALLNSSTDAAKSAISTYKLPADTKAYGSPDALAEDPDIDLVICNTRVDKHYETITPSVRAGKDVYVEWPIAAKREHVDELLAAAKKSGSRIAVGLQGRWAPPVAKLRELLEGGNGKLGKVLSVDVKAYGGTNDREILPVGLKYFAQREIGGNPIVIGFGHLFDTVLSVVGELDSSTIHAKAQLQRPSVRIRDTSTDKIVETITSDVPDLLSIHGALTPTSLAAPKATLCVGFRRGQPFPGTPPLVWTINCERGEIRLVSPSGTALQANAGDDVSIQIHRFDTDNVENVRWTWKEPQQALPLMARSVSECLYAFAEGREDGDGWAGIDSAAVRARSIERFLDSA